MNKVIDTVFGSGLKGTIKGAIEGSAFGAAIPILGMDVHTPAGKLAAGIAIWRFIYGLFRK